MSRRAARDAFLRDAGVAPDRAVALAGDASLRRYFRIPEAGLILMDSPPEAAEDIHAFAAATDWLRRRGFSAPRLHAADLDRGFLLLEDLGRALYRDVCAQTPEAEETLYAAAVDALAVLCAIPPPGDLSLDDGGYAPPPYDLDALLREARLLVDWYLPAATGVETPPDLAAEYAALVADAVAPESAARQTVVLRDCHAENLLWLPERRGIARVGLLDYQDALAGHAAYDLVSLLEDARRDTSAALREAMIARFLDRTGADPGPFRRAYSALGAQRNLKIIGIFARLSLRDGKTHYPAMIPRVWAHLQRDLRHPDLAALAAWVARRVPPPDPGVLDRLIRGAGRPDGLAGVSA